jgi:hypothetical protein
MADKTVSAPHGEIVITVPLAAIGDGNRALRDARDAAQRQAVAQNRTLTGEWGTQRRGKDLLIKFPLHADPNAKPKAVAKRKPPAKRKGKA